MASRKRPMNHGRRIAQDQRERLNQKSKETMGWSGGPWQT